MAEDATHRLLRYLNDAYASEMGGLVALKDLAVEATDIELKNVVTQHIEVTETQLSPKQLRSVQRGAN